MGSVNPVQANVDDWREYTALTLHPVLVAALEAFAEHGYHGASVRDIAQRVGMTVPAIYYHYKNKQDLLVSLLFGSIDEVLERCRQALAEAGAAPRDQLGALARAVVLYMANRRDLAFLDSEIRSLEPANREAYIAKRDELQGHLIDVIIAGCEDGSFSTSDPREAGRALLAMFQGVAQWYRPGGRLTADEVADRYALLALATVGAS